MRYHFSTRVLRAHVRMRIYSVEILCIILGKSLENIWLKILEREMTERKKNNHQLAELRVRELG